MNQAGFRDKGYSGFAGKCMYEKLIKCAAKTGFEIQSYIPKISN